MKVFCSFAYTDEDQAAVTRRMEEVRRRFDELGIESYCDLFDEECKAFSTPKEFIDDALAKMTGYDTLFVINTSERRSEGMLIEVGAALAREIPIVYAQHVSSVDKTYVPSLAARTFTWATDEELFDGIKKTFEQMI